jgi:glycine/D-amino acid oxidase-like deaminating enzyme
VLPGCAVRALETAAGKVAGVVTERGPIRCRTVVCAAGAWSGLFNRNLGVTLPQLQVRNSVCRTAPVESVWDGAIWSNELGMRRRQDGGYTIAHGDAIEFFFTAEALRFLPAFWQTFRQERAGIRLRFGRSFFDALATPKRWRADEVTPFEKVRVLDPTPSGKILGEALAYLGQAFPALKDVPVVERWAGMIDVTPDAIPVISTVDGLDGYVIATGFSGHGFGIGPGAGKLTSELVMGEATTVDPAPFRFSRFTDGSRLNPGPAV